MDTSKFTGSPKLFFNELDCITDALSEPIDPKIKSLVGALRLYGFCTRASCEGHTNRGLSYPWVYIGCRNEDHNVYANIQLMRILAKFNEMRGFKLEEWPDGAFRLRTYRLTLEKAQKRMNELAEFMIKEFYYQHFHQAWGVL